MTILDAEPARTLADTATPVNARRSRFRTIRVANRTLKATPVFDTYWRFACERQNTFMRRVRGEAPPWSTDPIISAHRFTNVYRASDRVSQFLIRHVQYRGDDAPAEVVFRTMIFKLFNRIETWQRLVDELSDVRWEGFDAARAERVLDRALANGEAVYSAAYIMPSPAFGAVRKHANHLRLVEHMMRDGFVRKLTAATSMEAAYRLLRGYPSFGDFLAFQLTIDLNYSRVTDFSEMDFVVAGPGARDGIRKCFTDVDGLSEADVVRAVADMAGAEFERLGLRFESLWGRPLQLIDCQNLFCEVDKYARVAHPEFSGESGRTRIKQKFVAAPRAVPQWYPPKWKIRPPAAKATPVARAKQAALFR